MGKRKNPLVVAIDFDETIGLYSPDVKDEGYIVKKVNNIPNPVMVKKIADLRKKGVRVIVWTSRWWGDYNELKRWFRRHKIKVDDIVCGRIKADAYICDKAVNAHSDTLDQGLAKILKTEGQWGIYLDKAAK